VNKRVLDSRPGDLITVTIRRADLQALHNALEIATDAPAAVVQPIVGTTQRMDFLKTIIRLRDAFLKGVYDHDDVPKVDRPDGAK
jgi:hypothetical protein